MDLYVREPSSHYSPPSYSTPVWIGVVTTATSLLLLSSSIYILIREILLGVTLLKTDPKKVPTVGMELRDENEWIQHIIHLTTVLYYLILMESVYNMPLYDF